MNSTADSMNYGSKTNSTTKTSNDSKNASTCSMMFLQYVVRKPISVKCVIVCLHVAAQSTTVDTIRMLITRKVCSMFDRFGFVLCFEFH